MLNNNGESTPPLPEGPTRNRMHSGEGIPNMDLKSSTADDGGQPIYNTTMHTETDKLMDFDQMLC